jgi:CheY-like chemotaxis protein
MHVWAATAMRTCLSRRPRQQNNNAGSQWKVRAPSGVRPHQPLTLIVHADVWVRAILSDLLTSAGWMAQQASNGASGLRLAVLLLPEILLVGPELSEVRPRELIDVLHADARTRWIPVVALGERGGFESCNCPHGREQSVIDGPVSSAGLHAQSLTLAS